jgi:hypothetical protein
MPIWVMCADMALNPAIIYDPRYHTFESWASLMCELYAPQQLEIPNQSTDWKEWAAGLKAIDVFNNEGAPSPYDFNDWQDWAQAMVGAVNPAVA